MSTFSPSPTDPSIPRIKKGTFNLSQVAGTYDILTASGDVWVEIQAAYVKTAAAGLTSALVVTDHATPKSIVASTLLASITLDTALTIVTSSFLLPSGKKIQGTIVGTGSSGEVSVVIRYTPLTAGATIA